MPGRLSLASRKFAYISDKLQTTNFPEIQVVRCVDISEQSWLEIQLQTTACDNNPSHMDSFGCKNHDTPCRNA